MAVDWTHGYASTWRVVRIDPTTWSPSGTLMGVDSASVRRSRGGLLEEGSMELTTPLGVEPESGWYRIEMLATQGSSSERVQVATLWFEPDSSRLTRGACQWSLTGQSVIAPAQASDAVVPDGSYARKGADAASVVAALLGDRTPAPVVADARHVLEDAVVYDLGSTEADAAWQVMTRCGICAQTDGDGTLHVRALPTSPVRRVSLPALGAAMSMADGDDGKPHRAWSYTREWWPDVVPYTMLEAVAAPGEAARLVRVDSQTLTLGRGASVQETVVEVDAA